MADNDLRQIVKQVASADGGEEKKSIERKQILVFVLDNEEYAADITELREIIKIPSITTIPNSAPWIRGIFNLRGKIVMVIDLEKRFNLVRENKIVPRHLVVTEVGGASFGIMVDEVKEVLWVDQDNVRSAPGLVTAKIKDDYIKGVVVFDQSGGDAKSDTKKSRISTKVSDTTSRLIVLIDIARLLSEQELLNISGQINQLN